MRKYFIPLATAVLFALSCEKGPEEVVVSGVSINHATAEMLVGENMQLSATVTPSDATYQSIIWSSTKESVATVSDRGLVTAVDVGSATIRAFAGGKSASCVITVSKKPIAVSSIKLNLTSLALTKGKSETLIATVTPADATDQTVSWFSSDSNVASVDSKGKVMATGNGSATITAKAGDQEATCAVTVTVPVESISLNKTELTLNKGDRETLVATVKPNDATEQTVTWSSSDLSVATITANGTVIAMGRGKATIMAKIGYESASCEITVKVPVKYIMLSQTSLTLNEGESVTLEAAVIPDDADNKAVTWSTSDGSIVSVNQDGTIHAIKQGSADIIAKAGDKQMTCAVTVVKQVTSITLDKDNLTLLVGNTSTLTATILPDDATDKTVMWASCNLDVATVENGVVKGIGVGETTIIATSGSVSAICDVLVLSDSEPSVFAEYCGDTSVIVNDIVKAGSNLEFDLFNYSSETIHVVSAQLIDGQTGVGGDVTSLDSDIASGSSDSLIVSVGESDMYLPIARFVYTFKGESYTCEAKMGSFPKAPRRYRNRP
jgi:uncharacterized protein YjdB